MEWQNVYEERKTNAGAAIRRIAPGGRIVLAHAAGVPIALTDELVRQKEHFKHAEIVQLVPMGNARFADADMEGYFRLNAFFLGPYTKTAVKEGRGDFTPCCFHEIPGLFGGMLPVDAALIQVSPPDRHGYVSLGISVDYTLAAVKKAKYVIAQVNGSMPRTHGDTQLHVSEIDSFVEINRPILELTPPVIGETEQAIGENCAKLICDGDTLQLGIGAIPDAVLLFLKDKKDLGIHSEMVSDGVVELITRGVITNARKTLHPGKTVATFLMGTKRLYDYADDNPSIALMPVEYVNDPYVIGQNDHLVSINSCVQVDLTGQVASESVGLTQISGIGGQLDFVRGARLSRGGRSVIAIASTAAKGKNKELAMDFLEFLGSEEAQKIQGESGAAIPAYNGLEDAWVQSFADKGYELTLENLIGEFEYSVKYVNNPSRPSWEPKVEQTMLDIYAGSVTIDEGIEKMQSIVTEAMEE